MISNIIINFGSLRLEVKEHFLAVMMEKCLFLKHR